MIRFERMRDRRDGSALAGFNVRNKTGNLLAIGADNPGSEFLVIAEKRYDNDRDLVAAIERITGITANTVEGRS